MFGYFLCYLLKSLPINLFLTIPILPIVCLGLLLSGRSTCWPISLLLWSITFGHSETYLQNLQEKFSHWFRQKITYFHVVQQRLNNYLISENVQVWLITGSPEILVKKVYHDATFFPKIRLIGSKIKRNYGGWILSMRCFGKEKVIQLERNLGKPLKLYSGYSDSSNDNPLLYFCQYKWKVTDNGNIIQINKK